MNQEAADRLQKVAISIDMYLYYLRRGRTRIPPIPPFHEKDCTDDVIRQFGGPGTCRKDFCITIYDYCMGNLAKEGPPLLDSLRTLVGFETLTLELCATGHTFFVANLRLWKLHSFQRELASSLGPAECSIPPLGSFNSMCPIKQVNCLRFRPREFNESERKNIIRGSPSLSIQ